jgi:hypothetical protein
MNVYEECDLEQFKTYWAAGDILNCLGKTVTDFDA